ncbi:hypothetical protein MNQ95_01630 [Pseudoxanthomonas daejeonensis]|uniref:Pathogenicity-like protein n=1 Tax=Pseudoxanthomonas daejeonensis TaxID=266062 RepID=A0ABQ6Z4F3_9GAMM|nr:hypothetical protein [Pseudoxanthomonas daejeonensis]KAF1692814.1 hypothetical protein CSC65_13425 [Pseudoxanthomonas daejeonensis]UNK57842.1 hypothetical protein MNQ95_01630 [Pseudoxanthomonas daejeonensis]
MRQVFTSQRLETVEGVARLLQDAGIDIYISQPRSYRGRRRGQFSYSEPVPANQQPAVWVRKAEDQPRARELLREAGLLATTRTSYSGLPTPATEALPSRFDATEGGDKRWAWRVRIGLLLGIAAVAMFIWIGRKPHPPVAPATPEASTAQPAPGTEEAGDDEEVRVRITPPPAG